MSIFKPNATEEDRRVVIRSIAGNVLLTFTAECAFANDIRSLRMLEEEGCFDFDLHDVYGIGSHGERARTRPRLSANALPMIDALGGVLDALTHTMYSYPSPLRRKNADKSLGSTPAAVLGTHFGIRCSDTVRVFLHDVCTKALEKLSRLGKEHTSMDDGNGEFVAVRGCHRASAGVTAALGYALDEPALVDLARKSFYEIDQQVDLLFALELRSDTDSPHLRTARLASPLAFGVAFQSVRCLNAADADLSCLWTRPLIHTPGIRDANGKNEAPLYLNDLLLDLPFEPSPAVMGVLLQKLTDQRALDNLTQKTGKAEKAEKEVNDWLLVQAFGSGPPPFAPAAVMDWLKGKFITHVAGGPWSHLLGATLDKAPWVFDLDIAHSCQQGLWHALPDLVSALSSHLVIPPLKPEAIGADLQAVMGDWYLPFHPIPAILDGDRDRDVPTADADGTMCVVLQTMKARGLLAGAQLARSNDDRKDTLAHLFVWADYPRSLAFLGQEGFDLTVRNQQGATPMALAQTLGKPKLESLLASLIARQQALKAINEIRLLSENSETSPTLPEKASP